LDCEVRIRLLDDKGKPFMGIGPVWLLERIRELKSISAAARDMRLSYPKALRMLRCLEEGLGYPVVNRRKGGAAHGGAELTPEGIAFLATYEQFRASVSVYANARFRRSFPGLSD